jgi:hypothetical protein
MADLQAALRESLKGYPWGALPASVRPALEQGSDQIMRWLVGAIELAEFERALALGTASDIDERRKLAQDKRLAFSEFTQATLFPALWRMALVLHFSGLNVRIARAVMKVVGKKRTLDFPTLLGVAAGRRSRSGRPIALLDELFSRYLGSNTPAHRTFREYATAHVAPHVVSITTEARYKKQLDLGLRARHFELLALDLVKRPEYYRVLTDLLSVEELRNEAAADIPLPEGDFDSLSSIGSWLQGRGLSGGGGGGHGIGNIRVPVQVYKAFTENIFTLIEAFLDLATQMVFAPDEQDELALNHAPRMFFNYSLSPDFYESPGKIASGVVKMGGGVLMMGVGLVGIFVSFLEPTPAGEALGVALIAGGGYMAIEGTAELAEGVAGGGAAQFVDP